MSIGTRIGAALAAMVVLMTALWLENLDRRRDRVLPILRETYGARRAKRWFRRWRIFFMACAERFGYRGGDEWQASHTLLSWRP